MLSNIYTSFISGHTKDAQSKYLRSHVDIYAMACHLLVQFFLCSSWESVWGDLPTHSDKACLMSVWDICPWLWDKRAYEQAEPWGQMHLWHSSGRDWVPRGGNMAALMWCGQETVYGPKYHFWLPNVTSSQIWHFIYPMPASFGNPP